MAAMSLDEAFRTIKRRFAEIAQECETVNSHFEDLQSHMQNTPDESFEDLRKHIRLCCESLQYNAQIAALAVGVELSKFETYVDRIRWIERDGHSDRGN
jgi:hypothetical protein